MDRVALYDLSVMPTTFDFAIFAVIARTLGYEEVRFSTDRDIAKWKYPAEIGWKRWANILIPLCSLSGLKFSVGHAVLGDVFGYGTGDIEKLYLRTKKIEKLKSNHSYDKSGYVTITMRESFRNQWRNSNKPEWEKVKKWLEDRGEEVIIIPECEHQPIALEYRMAIYENAKMNLAVGNGPMVMCWLSEAPYLTFQLPKGEKEEYDSLCEQWKRLGFPVGSQLSFRNERQEIIWGPDDFDTVIKAYQRHFPGLEQKTA